MAPGLTGIVGGRPTVYPLIRLFSFLIDKTACTLEIDMGQRHPAPCPLSIARQRRLPAARTTQTCGPADASVALVKLAVARSGDKGNHSNIGVMAATPNTCRGSPKPDPGGLVDWMSHVLDPIHGRVERWYLPGTHSLNFLLENALGGGGVASLRIDPARPSPSNCWKSRFRCLSASPTRSTRGLPPWPTIRFSKPICLQARPSSSPVAAVASAVAPPMNWPPSARTCCWSDARPTS
jgi:hypothetical protein